MSTSESRRRLLATSPFAKPYVEPVAPEVYAVTDRVSHDKYGLGTVVSVDGTMSVVVDFGAETRRIGLPNPKLALL